MITAVGAPIATCGPYELYEARNPVRSMAATESTPSKFAGQLALLESSMQLPFGPYSVCP